MTGRLKVAHIIGSTGLYGAERWVLAMIRSADTRQVDYTLVNLVDGVGEPSDVARAARSRDINAVDFDTGGRFNPIAVIRFANWVRRNRFDILHGHGYKSDIFSLIAGRLANICVISTPHGWSKEEKDWKLKLYESLDRKCLRYLDHVCPLSPELWEDLNKCGVKAIRNTYICNGVDLEEADRVVTREGKPGGTAIVGYVGQLIERKNIPVLLEAFRIAIRKKGNLQLLIVGDGPMRQDLSLASETMGIADRVRFSGYCEDALALMKMFDVFVLPSHLEGIPRCVMEAMALGVPVVASDIPGNRELVEHLRTGMLFPSNSPEKLSEAILFMLDGTEEVQEMCKKARHKIEDKFSAKRMGEEYSSLYRRLSGNPDHIRM